MSRSGPEEKMNFRGLNASILVIFLSNTPKISRGIIFFCIRTSKNEIKAAYGAYNSVYDSAHEYGRVGAPGRQYK